MKRSMTRPVVQAKAEVYRARAALLLFALGFITFCLLTQILRLMAE